MPLGVWFMGRLGVEELSVMGVCAAVPLVVVGVRDGTDVFGVGSCDVWPFAVMLGLLDLRFVPKPKFLNLELIKSVRAMFWLESFQKTAKYYGVVVGDGGKR